jgi:hypothetical protein
MLAQMGGLGLSLGLGSVNPYAGQAIMQGYGLGTQMGILLPYSRKQESEADQVGLILMAKAGYDPAGAIVFWERMMQKDKDKARLPQVLSSHPTDANRILAMKEFLPQARRHYRERPCAGQPLPAPPSSGGPRSNTPYLFPDPLPLRSACIGVHPRQILFSFLFLWTINGAMIIFN